MSLSTLTSRVTRRFDAWADTRAEHASRACGGASLSAAQWADLTTSFAARCRIADIPAQGAQPAIPAGTTRALLQQQIHTWLRDPHLRPVAQGMLLASHCDGVVFNIHAESQMATPDLAVEGLFRPGDRWWPFASVTCGPLTQHNGDAPAFNPDAAATLAHESLHALFYLSHDGRSPSPAHNEAERTTLTAACLDDMQARATRWLRPMVSEGNLANRAREMRSFNIGHYFTPHLDVHNQRHLDILHAEAIVRPVQALVEGFSPTDVRALSPAVFDWYQCSAQAHIATYLQSRIRDMQNEIIVPRADAPALSPDKRHWYTRAVTSQGFVTGLGMAFAAEPLTRGGHMPARCYIYAGALGALVGRIEAALLLRRDAGQPGWEMSLHEHVKKSEAGMAQAACLYAGTLGAGRLAGAAAGCFGFGSARAGARVVRLPATVAGVGALAIAKYAGWKPWRESTS